MKTFKFEIIETLSRVVEVQALSEDDACREIKKQYHNEDIVLGSEAYVDTEIIVFEE